MPIKPENRPLYGPDLKTRIVPMIRERSRNRCEGSPQYPYCTAGHGEPHPVTGSKVVLTVAHATTTRETTIQRTSGTSARVAI